MSKVSLKHTWMLVALIKTVFLRIFCLALRDWAITIEFKRKREQARLPLQESRGLRTANYSHVISNGLCEFELSNLTKAEKSINHEKTIWMFEKSTYTSSRDSPSARSIRLCACTHFAHRIYLTNVLTSAVDWAKKVTFEWMSAYCFELGNTIWIWWECRQIAP